MDVNNGGHGGFRPQVHRLLGFGDPFELFWPRKYALAFGRASVAVFFLLRAQDGFHKGLEAVL